jgi:hypothetical protein
MITPHTYSVRTWDPELQAYTPQIGIEKWQGLSLWELKAALRALRSMGYSAHRSRDDDRGHDDNDWAVLVERDDEQTDGTR